MRNVAWDVYIAGEHVTRVWYMGYMQHLLERADDIMFIEVEVE